MKSTPRGRKRGAKTETDASATSVPIAATNIFARSAEREPDNNTSQDNNDTPTQIIGAEVVKSRAFGLPRSGPYVSPSSRFLGLMTRVASRSFNNQESLSNNNGNDDIEIPHARLVADDVIVVVDAEVSRAYCASFSYSKIELDFDAS